MWDDIYHKIADFQDEKSFAKKIRLKRMAIFNNLTKDLPKPIKILDVGGTELFHEIMGLAGNKDYMITILNLSESKTRHKNIKSVKGNACQMKEFDDYHFDVVFSNSVIEHVGNFEDQKMMADEMQRLAKKFFLQTPNFYSPVEPHFFIPLFQFLPIQIQIFLVQNFNCGYLKKTPNKKEAKKVVRSIRLLKESEIKKLFPESIIKKERFLGFTLSFIVYCGF